jgi:nucleotide-binding universal stress UspA family protein
MAIETIVVAVGSSDMNRVARLAEEAVEVAEPTDAHVVLVHAFTEDGFEEALDVLEFDRDQDEVDPDDVARRHTPVVRLREVLEEAGIDHSVRGGVGDRAETVVTVAEESDADLVYVGGKRRSPTGKAVFGSTAQEILFSAPCPVTYVREDTT